MIDSPVVNISENAYLADDPLALTKIFEPDCNIAVWQNAQSSGLSQSIQFFLNAGGLLNVTEEVDIDTCHQALQRLLPEQDFKPELQDYISQLVDMFCCLFDTDAVGLRLRTLDKPMCPKFHVDRVICRMVTTFCGLGTQWLPNNRVDRSRLGAGSGGVADNVSGLYKNASDVQGLHHGDVALFKGERWPGQTVGGIVHRSPEVLAGQKRLMLSLDILA